ncbi:MAG: PQQ-dependent sugar dehydrogenase, partial [Bacteroidota bacterium]|nr:PQQ-dependent sugar dehydrogenase [Bacteroidota bacterium]
SIAQPYAIPSSNPFFSNNASGIKKEIWAYGVRNPFRSSFDRLTGDLLTADVGASTLEEVNFQNANYTGGTNYGWYIVEGDSCLLTTTCDKTGLTLPIYEYFHNGGSAAVIGGYVVRSAQSKALWGQYIFADFISKWIHGFFLSNGMVSGNINEFITPEQSTGNPISFGEDRYGDQYVLFNNNGTVYKLDDTSYLRHPKAYITSVAENSGASYLLQGIQGRNLTYQWLRNNVPIQGENLPDYDVNSNGNYTLIVTNDLGFSDTSDVFPFGALPLNFLSFTAQEAEPNKVNLQWKTSAEQNVNGYNVLRKQSTEMDFSNIGFVQSKGVDGNSNSKLDYSFFDTSVSPNSTIFYRLQIENKDGGYTYSNIISILTSKDKNIFSIYPNPAKKQFTVYISKFTRPVIMNIYDNNGQKVKVQILSQQNTTVKITGTKGIYIVQLSNMDGSNLDRKKLLVE